MNAPIYHNPSLNDRKTIMVLTCIVAQKLKNKKTCTRLNSRHFVTQARAFSFFLVGKNAESFILKLSEVALGTGTRRPFLLLLLLLLLI
jgi:hypothetical protein